MSTQLSADYTSHGTPLASPQDVSRNFSASSRSHLPSDITHHHIVPYGLDNRARVIDVEKQCHGVTSVASPTSPSSSSTSAPVDNDDQTVEKSGVLHSSSVAACQRVRPVSMQRVPSQYPDLALSRTPSHVSLKTSISSSALRPTVSVGADGHVYPEGGSQAWLCVLGSFCGMMASLGIMNSVGTLQAYVLLNQLAGYEESKVGWIFSVYAFLSFFCGIQIGPLFDAKGPRWLMLAGSVFVALMWFFLGVCTKYWHFIIVFGVIGGFGTSLIFTPCIAAVGHWFLYKRGLATGIAATGGSLGGVIFPLVLQSLFPKLGWAWSTRIIGFISIILLVVANVLVKSRLPFRTATKKEILPDLRIFRDPVFALTTLGIFFIEWALFIPLTYLTSYAISQNIDEKFAFQIMAIFNAGSCFGRWMPGMIADKIGRFNTMLVTVLICLVSTLALWLPADSSVPLIVVYSVIFGFASGTGISLTPVCVSQLCKVENYGRYYATCYTLVSFACLTGIPIAGSLVNAKGGGYRALIVFTGCSYAASLITFVFARGLGTDWIFKRKY